MMIDNPGRWLGVFGLVAMVGTISGAMYASRLYMRRRRSAITSEGIALGFSSAADDEVIGDVQQRAKGLFGSLRDRYF